MSAFFLLVLTAGSDRRMVVGKKKTHFVTAMATTTKSVIASEPLSPSGQRRSEAKLEESETPIRAWCDATAAHSRTKACIAMHCNLHTV